MIHRLDSVPSTNTWAKEHPASLAHGDIVITRDQTAGRGQRGNSWEAAPGMNLTFSLMLRPRNITPRRQWAISQAVALGISEALDHILRETGAAPGGSLERVAIKWPNDIYVGDRKICGILIENSLESPERIGHSIAGIGINVNQPEFVSDAPNPVSLRQLTGVDFDLDDVLDQCVGRVMHWFDIAESGNTRLLDDEYDTRLWRRSGVHEYALPDGTRFRARIMGVENDGRLKLIDTDDTIRRFYFKETAFVL